MVVAALVQISLEEKYLTEENVLLSMNLSDSRKVLTQAFNTLVKRIKEARTDNNQQERRVGELSIITIYNDLKSKKVKEYLHSVYPNFK